MEFDEILFPLPDVPVYISHAPPFRLFLIRLLILPPTEPLKLRYLVISSWLYSQASYQFYSSAWCSLWDARKFDNLPPSPNLPMTFSPPFVFNLLHVGRFYWLVFVRSVEHDNLAV